MRLPAEEGCADSAQRSLPPLPPRPVVDPYQLPRPELLILNTGQPRPITFLCDLPDRILAIAATQTVQGGQRVVAGRIEQLARAPVPDGARADAMDAPLPSVDIVPTSPGCKPDQPTCEFMTRDRELAKVAMLRSQWIHTGGWVSGREDMCRALPDDTIAVCSTRERMAYVELGCKGQLQLGIHDTSLPRTFDLDVEVPVARLVGQVAADNSATRWSATFTNPDAARSMQASRYQTAALQVNLDPGNERGELVVDGTREPCFVFGLYRR